MSRLAGKAALILGAAGKDNLGQVMARAFAREGARVLIAGRSEAPLAELAEEMGCDYALCDITSREDVDALVDQTKQRLGRIDVAVQATGWGLIAPFLETSEEDLDRITTLQFQGPFQFFQALVRAMDQGGSIINISSATATIMLDDHAAYMGTKAGIDHVIRCIANEFGARGIRANSISPGLMVTPMTQHAAHTPGVIDAFTKEYPLGRIGTSEDIAEAAIWLASDACFMTGENLQVNGGLTLRRNPTRAEIGAHVVKATQSAA